MILRTIICGICDKKYTEETEGAGWPGWGTVQGISPTTIAVCPEHLLELVDWINKKAGE